jgi:hypothetical protein
MAEMRAAKRKLEELQRRLREHLEKARLRRSYSEGKALESESIQLKRLKLKRRLEKAQEI